MRVARRRAQEAAPGARRRRGWHELADRGRHRGAEPRAGRLRARRHRRAQGRLRSLSPARRLDEGRDRRAAERRQVVAVQRAHAGGRRGGQLPVHDDRAERRRRARRRRAPRAGGRRRSAPSEVDPRHDRLPRHRRPGRAARTRARGWATSSSPTSARPTRSCTSCASTTTSGVVHPEGRVDPAADIDTIETELLYADLEQAERRLERVSRQTTRGGDAAAVAEEAWLRELIAALQEGRPARTVPVPADAPDALRARCSRSPPSRCCTSPTSTRATTRCPAAVAEHAARARRRAVAVSARHRGRAVRARRRRGGGHARRAGRRPSPGWTGSCAGRSRCST